MLSNILQNKQFFYQIAQKEKKDQKIFYKELNDFSIRFNKYININNFLSKKKKHNM